LQKLQLSAGEIALNNNQLLPFSWNNTKMIHIRANGNLVSPLRYKPDIQWNHNITAALAAVVLLPFLYSGHDDITQRRRNSLVMINPVRAFGTENLTYVNVSLFDLKKKFTYGMSW
jgi:hypothetical protein